MEQDTVKPGGRPKWQWYALGAVLAVALILFIRSRGSSSSTGATSTSVPDTTSQQELQNISDQLTGLNAALNSGVATPASSAQAGATQPASSSTGLSAPFYSNLLGRAGDTSGSNYWNTSGLNQSQLFVAFGGSPEGIAYAQSIPSSQYVSQEYAALGLTPDTSGVAWWQGQLTQDIASAGSTAGGYQLEQKQFANEAAKNPGSSNYQQPVYTKQ